MKPWLLSWAEGFIERYTGRDKEPLNAEEVMFELTEIGREIHTLHRRIERLESVLKKLGVG